MTFPLRRSTSGRSADRPARPPGPDRHRCTRGGGGLDRSPSHARGFSESEEFPGGGRDGTVGAEGRGDPPGTRRRTFQKTSGEFVMAVILKCLSEQRPPLHLGPSGDDSLSACF